MKTSLPFNYKVYAKKNKLYVVIDYKVGEKRKRKWIPTGLDEGTKKKEVNEVADRIAGEFFQNFLEESTAGNKAVEERTVGVCVKEETAAVYEFTDFMFQWLETIKPTVARSTYAGYKTKVRLIANYFKDKNLYLHTIKPIDIQTFYNELYNQGNTANTVKHYHANIHKALKYAVKMELIPSNPADKVELPKMEKYEATFYNKEELEKLFEVFKGDRMELVLYIGAYYGLRRSEIVGLKWDAIDFDQKTITICRKVISEFGLGKEVIICESELKTAASKRTLPLIPQIEKMLLEHRETLSNYKKLLKSGFDDTYSDYVCCDNFGKLITPEFVSNHFRYIVQREGLRKLRFHDLRHSCASLLLANGVPMKAIQDWLGHSTFNVTANFYSHLDYNSKIASAETISKVFGGITKEEEEK
jgi:integrase